MRTEDGRIIQECLNGKPEVFGLLVDKYKEGIYAFVYSEIRDFHDAQDVTQEVFLDAYRDLRSLRRWESFVFWLYRIARRRCALWFRIGSRRVDGEFIEDQDPRVVDASSLASYRRDQLGESVREALDALPAAYREVLMLRYFGGMNSKEIAEALGVSPTAVRMRLSRARAQLREEMVGMMDTTLESQKLPTGFTFRIVEAVKHIKIHPMPRVAGLPWGLSLAVGIIITVLSLNQHLTIPGDIAIPTGSPLPAEMRVPRIGEIPVDVLKLAPRQPISSKGGDDYGGRNMLPNQQNAFLLAPRKENGTFPKEPTARLGKGTLMKESQGIGSSLAYSPDGRLIAAAGGAGVWLFNADDLTEVGLLKGHTSPVSCVDFSPDGRLLASGGWRDKTVRLWDVEKQEKIALFWGQADYVSSVTFSPDGKLIAAAGTSGDWRKTAVRFLDVATRKEIAVIRRPGEWIYTLSFSPDGKLLAAGSSDKVVRIWSVGEAEEIAVLEGHTGTVRSVFFNSDGSLLVSASGDSTIRLWDMEEKKEIATLEGHTLVVFCLSLSPDGKLLASASADRTVRLWDIVEREEVGVLKEYDTTVWGVFFSPNGERLALGIGVSAVRLWDMAEQKEVAELEGYTSYVWDVAFSPDGKILVSGEENNIIRLWSVEEGKEVARLSGRLPVSLSPDGKLLASEGQDNTILLWDVERRMEIAVLEGHKANVSSISFSPDGKLLASGGGRDDKTIRLWDVEKREEIDMLEGHTEAVICVAFSPDGELLASGGGDGDNTVRLWDVKTGMELSVLRGHTRVVCDVVFSHDGDTLYSGGYDRRIRFWDVWDPETPFEIAQISTQSIDALALSPDGRFLVSGERDNMVKVWDVAEKKLVTVLNGHNTWPISSLSFSPDGKWLASGSFDGTVLLWDMAPGQSVEPGEKQLATWGKLKRTELYQNYPNPFNPETWIPFSLSEPKHVIIRIYTSTGQLTRTLDLGQKPSGAYLTKEKAAYWDGRNEDGEMAASDVYFYAMEAGEFTDLKKMAIAR